MARLSRSKVSRIASTGGSGRRRGDSSAGFLVLLAVLAVIGIALVVFSRDQRLDATTPNTKHPWEPVASQTNPEKNREGDRWYEAYGIYVCDKFLPVINSTADKFGLSTMNDGVIYIHPYEKKFAGANSTIGLFADGFDIKLKEESLQVPGDTTVYKTDETKCGDQTGELVIREWENATKADKAVVIKKDLRDVRVKNNAAVTIAFVPKGKTDIPIPPSVGNGALAGAKEKEEKQAASAMQSTLGTATGGESSAPASGG